MNPHVIGREVLRPVRQIAQDRPLQLASQQTTVPASTALQAR
jgi:hypothetical protein